MSHVITRCLIASAVLFAIMSKASAADDDDEKPAKPTAPAASASGGISIASDALSSLGIAIQTVAERALVARVEAPAIIAPAPMATADVISTFTARVISVDVLVGQQVDQGAPLATLESAEFARAWSSLRSNAAAVAGVKAAADAAHRSAERARTLGDGGVSSAEAQRRAADAVQADAAVAAAEADRDSAAADLRAAGLDDRALAVASTGEAPPKLILRSPLKGVVTRIAASVGMQVAAGSGAVFTIADPTRAWALADVTTASLARLTVGDSVEVTIEARSVPGHVAMLPRSVDEASLLARIGIALDEVVGAPLGILAHVAIAPKTDAMSPPVLAVPEASVMRVGDHDVVFTATRDGEHERFDAHTVVVGPTVSGWRAVLSGLAAGDRIAVAGAVLLKAELLKNSLKDED